MKIKTLVAGLMAGLNIWLIPAAECQPLDCTDQFFVSLYQTSNPTTTTFYSLDLDQVAFSEVFTATAFINAIGFNRIDRYIYAVRRNTPDIIRIAADGSILTVGTEPLVVADGGWITGAGDVTPDGRFVVKQRPRNSLFIYQLNPTFQFVDEVPLIWHPSSGNSGVMSIHLDDLVFDPCDPHVAYTYQRGYDSPGNSEPPATRNHLLRIDLDPDSPDYGAVFVIAQIDPSVVNHLGAMFFNARGELYAYGAGELIFPLVQDRLVKIDPQNGDVTLIGTGPGASGNDGCSCPYTVAMSKRITSVEAACGVSRITYEFTLTNKTYEDVNNLTFIDELPAGGRIEAVDPPDPFGVPSVPGTGVMTDELRFEDFTLNEGDTVSFQIVVSTETTGDFSNQATLENLPSFLGGSISSDDPTTPAPNDPTTVPLSPPAENFITLESTALLCNGDSIAFGDLMLTTAGTYEYIAENQSSFGCDTLFQITVEVVDEITIEVSAQLCSGENYSWRDTTLDAGTHEIIVPALTGNCDTVFSFSLEELPPAAGRTELILCGDEVAVLNGLTYRIPGEYELRFPAAAATGCDSTLLLEVFPPLRIYVPSAFSPHNRDGVNDVLTLYSGVAGTIKRFDVFDRWGNHVYRLEAAEINGGIATWAGRFRGRPAPAGVYVYALSYTCGDGSDILLKGNVHLVN